MMMVMMDRREGLTSYLRLANKGGSPQFPKHTKFTL